MEILSSCWEIYSHILPHYKYLIKDLNGFRLYIWDDKRGNHPEELPVYQRISSRRDPSMNFVIVLELEYIRNLTKKSS